MLTRIIQSFGRCTRSATDYSIVVIFGDRLVSYLAKKDRQVFFHPELQGELLFGLEESSSTSVKNTLENVQTFLSQSKEWKSAEAQIYAYRDKATNRSCQGRIISRQWLGMKCASSKRSGMVTWSELWIVAKRPWRLGRPDA